MTTLILPSKTQPDDLWKPLATPAHYTPKLIKDGENVIVYQPLDWEYEMACLARQTKYLLECERLGIRPLMGAAAGNWTFTDATRTDKNNGTYDFDTDSFKEALFLSTSNLGAATTTFAAVTNEHAAANGYTAGGIAVTIALSGTTTLTVDSTTNPVWTAAGGSITARFCALYEVAGRVPCYFLLDSTPADVTATDGNTLTVTHHANGVFQEA